MLKIKLNDHIIIGSKILQIRAIIKKEPDRITNIINFGPRLLIYKNALKDSGLIQPGSQVYYHYKLTIPKTSSLKDWLQNLNSTFPAGGWRIRSPNNASQGVTQFIDRMSMFLHFVGPVSYTHLTLPTKRIV